MMIQKANQLKAMLGIMQMISGNPLLVQMFMQEISLEKLVNKLFELSNIDLSKLKLSQREKLIRQVSDPMQGLPGAQPMGQGSQGGPSGQPGGAPQGAPPGAAKTLPNGGHGVQNEMQGIARSMGIGR